MDEKAQAKFQMACSIWSHRTCAGNRLVGHAQSMPHGIIAPFWLANINYTCECRLVLAGTLCCSQNLSTQSSSLFFPSPLPFYILLFCHLTYLSLSAHQLILFSPFIHLSLCPSFDVLITQGSLGLASLAGYIPHAPSYPMRGVMHKKGYLSDMGIFNTGAD